jgi:hypothetical protein
MWGPSKRVDPYTHPERKKAFDLALATWKPIVTAPLETGHQLNSNMRSVVLVHPGMPITSNPSIVPRDLSIMGIHMGIRPVASYHSWPTGYPCTFSILQTLRKIPSF